MVAGVPLSIPFRADCYTFCKRKAVNLLGYKFQAAFKCKIGDEHILQQLNKVLVVSGLYQVSAGTQAETIMRLILLW